MAWYNDASDFWNNPTNILGDNFLGTGVGAGNALEKYDAATNRDPNNLAGGLKDQADRAGAWADESRIRVGGLTAESKANRRRLQDIATGKESVSAMQLAQANQQNQSQQQSMAAGARPGNAAMAARGAAMNAGRMGAGLAGQQALAGIQERQAAQSALSQALLAERGQDVGATGQGYGTAAGAYGSALGAALQTPTKTEKGLGLITDFGKYLGMGG